jgi:hypothetical protein
MGRRQHQSDKLWISNKEWAEDFGGKKKKKGTGEFKRLPFDCCAISLQPFEFPAEKFWGFVPLQATFRPFGGPLRAVPPF